MFSKLEISKEVLEKMKALHQSRINGDIRVTYGYHIGGGWQSTASLTEVNPEEWARIKQRMEKSAKQVIEDVMIHGGVYTKPTVIDGTAVDVTEDET